MAILRAVGSVARFLYDFVVGDDPLVAVGVALALGGTALLAGAGAGGWWLTLAAVPVLLAVSLARSIRRPT